MQYEIYLRAKRLQADSGAAFPDAFARAFRERFARLDDRTAALVARTFNAASAAGAPRPPPTRRWPWPMLSPGSAACRSRRLTPSSDGSRRRWSARTTSRRYVMESNIQVKTPDGATVCAMVWRPRTGPSRLPALLQFTIYADTTPLLFDLRRNASNGYAAVMGFTRGKACSPDAPVPYVHDGADAAALIDWIAAQPWSDGRVGMYGGSYSGMSPWAAAKRAPPALKAIMVGAPVAPGVDVPMEGNIVWNFVYPWPFYTTNTKALDDATYNDRDRWSRLDNALVRERPRLPRPGQDRRHAQPDLARLDRAPGLRRVLAGHDPVRTRVRRHQDPGAARPRATTSAARARRSTTSPSTTGTTRAPSTTCVIGPYDHFQAQRGVGERAGRHR